MSCLDDKKVYTTVTTEKNDVESILIKSDKLLNVTPMINDEEEKAGMSGINTNTSSETKDAQLTPIEQATLNDRNNVSASLILNIFSAQLFEIFVSDVSEHAGGVMLLLNIKYYQALTKNSKYGNYRFKEGHEQSKVNEGKQLSDRLCMY